MKSQTAALEITYLPVTSLKPNPKNPRIHTEKQVSQIAQSIEAFGFNVPILVDERQNIVAGHGRLLAARKLGWSTVPVIKLNHLSEAQYSALLIADNRLTENSSWMNGSSESNSRCCQSWSSISIWRSPASRWARSMS